MYSAGSRITMHRRITSDFSTNYDHSFNLNHQPFADDKKQIKDRKLYQAKEVRGKYFFGETPTHKKITIEEIDKKKDRFNEDLEVSTVISREMSRPKSKN